MKTALAIKRPSQANNNEPNPDKAKALEAVKKTKTFRLSVDLDGDLYDELKAQAVKERRTGVMLVRDAIRAYLDNNKR